MSKIRECMAERPEEKWVLSMREKLYTEISGKFKRAYEILMTIQEHPFLKGLDFVQEHFWNMFVVDALIGNTDRNNSNWGIIIRENGKKLNPYHLIEGMEYKGCNDAVRKITPKMETALPEIEKMILEIPVLTEIQKKYYLTVMEERYEKVFKPICQKLMRQELEE